MGRFAAFSPAREALWLMPKSQPKQALEALQPTALKNVDFNDTAQDQIYTELVTYAMFEQKRYLAAAEFCLKRHAFFLSGYAFLLNGQLKQCQQAWRYLAKQCKQHWAFALLGLITSDVKQYPTFLQIRHYIEADIVNLHESGQLSYLNQLLRYSQWLAQINPEVYKLIGRSFLGLGELKRAEAYLLKGQQTYPQDAEIYFHLGQYYHAAEQPKVARLMLNQCLMINAHYNPARLLREQLQ